MSDHGSSKWTNAAKASYLFNCLYILLTSCVISSVFFPALLHCPCLPGFPRVCLHRPGLWGVYGGPLVHEFLWEQGNFHYHPHRTTVLIHWTCYSPPSATRWLTDCNKTHLLYSNHLSKSASITSAQRSRTIFLIFLQISTFSLDS